MAVFEGDKLRPEESLGGFEPGQTGDDTFYLDQSGNYPGVLPDYQVLQAEESIPLEQKLNLSPEPVTEFEDTVPSGIDNEIHDVPEDSSVWDLFDNNAGADTTDVNDTNREPISDVAEEVSINKSAYLPDEAVQIDVDFSNIKPMPMDRLDDLMNAPEPEPEPTMEKASEFEAETFQATQQQEAIEDVDQIDKDLLDLLSSDIDDGKKKRDKKIAEEDAIPILSGESFTPIEDGENIDLTGIDAVHPSTYGLNAVKADNIQMPPLEPIPIPIPIPPPKEEVKPKEKKVKEKKPKAVKEPKEKKEKSKTQKLLIIALVAMLIFALLSGASYYLFFNPGNATKAIKGMMAKKGDQKKKDKDKLAQKKVEQKKAMSKHEEPKKVELKQEAPKSEPIKTEVKPENLAKVETQIEKKEEQKTEVKEKAEKQSTIVKKTTEPKQVVKKTTEPKQAVKKTKEAKQATDSKALAHKKVKKNNTKVPLQPTDIKELYTVQVYTTPSRDDAEEWLKKLRKRKINNSYIVSGKVRDRIWFRVRFGSFDSHAEAKSEALKYGFAQSWIDRIR